MVRTEIAHINVFLESDGEPTADIFVSGALVHKNAEIKNVVKETAEKLVVDIFEKLDMEVAVSGYVEH